MKLIIALLIAALGVALAIYSGNDDAPGGVLLGLLLVAAAVVLGVRYIRSRRPPA